MPRGIRKDKFYDESMMYDQLHDEDFQSTSPAEVETTGPETINGIITNALSVKARDAANPEGKVVDVLTKGDRVRILGESHGFYKVETNRKDIVYVSKKFVVREE